MNPRYEIRPEYIAGANEALLLVSYVPHAAERGIVLLAPPFAEEMNRSRKQVAMQARALANVGYRVAIVDLSGTGDSGGDFESATLECWALDLVAAAAHFGRDVPLTLWGVRMGALIAAYARKQHGLAVDRWLFCSPVLRGTLFMTQFLRLRMLSAMIATDDKSGENLVDIKARLSDGETVEIAGYPLSAGLYGSLDALALSDLISADDMAPMGWFEMAARPGAELPVAARNGIRALQGDRVVSTTAVAGPKYWETAEISTSPQLIAAVVDWMCEDPA